MSESEEPTTTEELITTAPFRSSARIGELVDALTKAQLELGELKKNRTAKLASYSYSYANLGDLMDCVRKPLAKHGLWALQPMRFENGHFVLVTILAHRSGQWIASDYPLNTYERPQEMGSAITYARRYAISALLGIAAEEDDDGKAAQDAQPVRREEAVPTGDAAEILAIAHELAQYGGGDAYEHIRRTSSFVGSDGKTREFAEPSGVRSSKWLKGTKDKLLVELSKLRGREPGVDEAVELFK